MEKREEKHVKKCREAHTWLMLHQNSVKLRGENESPASAADVLENRLFSSLMWLVEAQSARNLSILFPASESGCAQRAGAQQQTAAPGFSVLYFFSRAAFLQTQTSWNSKALARTCSEGNIAKCKPVFTRMLQRLFLLGELFS